MPFESKYKKKYSKMLLEGLRSDGKSVVECCRLFKVAPKTYYNWIKDIPEFAEAAAMGDLDCAEWWHKVQRTVASGVSAGNAAVINFAMKNVDGIKWVDKTEIHNTHEEQIRTIKIEMLPQRDIARVIEHERVKSLPNEKPS